MNHAALRLLLEALPPILIVSVVALKFWKMRSNPLTSGGPFTTKLPGVRVDDPALKARLVAALQERRAIEPTPLWSKAARAFAICAALALGTVAFSQAVTLQAFCVLYGLLCLGFAALILQTYVNSRNQQPVRVAILHARTPAHVIPVYWFVVIAISGLCVLANATQPEIRLASVLVCISTWATVFIGWKTAQLPARLSGNDIEVERFIDERLRFRRAAEVLLLAIFQSHIFLSIVVVRLNDGAVGQSSWIAGMVIFFAYVVWFARQIRRKPALNGAAT